MEKEFIEKAINDTTWNLGNQVLYDLCEKRPGHKAPDAIAAKLWLIGRSYAAALERRKENREKEFIGDKFFANKAIPTIQNSNIDTFIDAARQEAPGRTDAMLLAHRKLQDLFVEITGLEKRSLASKYLHFHLPGKFFLYDSRADRAVRKLVPTRIKRSIDSKSDFAYKAFVLRCMDASKCLSAVAGMSLTPRALDKVFLAYIADQES
jgi:hypothetical protein